MTAPLDAPSWLTSFVSVVVVVAWIFTLAIGAYERDWTALTIVTPVMMLLAGYAFGIKIIRRQREDSDDRTSRGS